MTPMDLLALARAFATDGVLQAVEPLGHGNVNATYVVRTDSGRRYVLQQLNTTVFTRPELVMANLEALATHAAEPVPWQRPLRRLAAHRRPRVLAHAHLCRRSPQP